MVLYTKSHDFAEAKGAPRESARPSSPRAAVAPREHSLLVVTNGATEAEAAEAKVAETHATERMTTVLRDSNRMKCSAVKPTCCGRTTGALPSCGYQKIATEAEAAKAEATTRTLPTTTPEHPPNHRTPCKLH